ncbi:MAG: hypothetical protein K6E18_08035 [Lachnospiraceae bacterium]|nr:hypothetical protein [Lachnospiraceae bacterium]
MSSLFMVADCLLYIFSAAYFAVISRKLFLHGKSKAAAVVLFMISPSVSVFLPMMTQLWFENVQDGLEQALLKSAAYAVFELLLQFVFLVIYIKVVRAKNPSIAVFIYLCSAMLVPGIIFLFDAAGTTARHRIYL